jgi:hypothetical protein
VTLSLKLEKVYFMISMSDVKFKIIGKVIAVDLDAEGNLHLTLRHSNQYWSEHAAKHLRELTNQIIETEIKKWTPHQNTIKNQ